MSEVVQSILTALQGAGVKNVQIGAATALTAAGPYTLIGTTEMFQSNQATSETPQQLGTTQARTWHGIT